MQTISGHTAYTCLLGNPVAHSMSPALHNAAFDARGLDFVYLAHPVEAAQFDEAVAGLKAVGVVGFNVTTPHKQRMAALCDELSPEAALIGAVNTVHHVNGRLIGYNTDGRGYLRAAEDAGYPLVGEKITVFGAGGTAAAILTQAAFDGVRAIDVFSTRPEQAAVCLKQVEQTTGCRIRTFQTGDETALAQSLSDSKLLVNGTPVGMAPKVEGCLLPQGFALPEGLVVSDVIYHPRQTTLLQRAEQQGNPFFNGLYMLLYQADEAFYIWTGKRMPIALLKERFYQD